MSTTQSTKTERSPWFKLLWIVPIVLVVVALIVLGAQAFRASTAATTPERIRFMETSHQPGRIACGLNRCGNHAASDAQRQAAGVPVPISVFPLSGMGRRGCGIGLRAAAFLHVML